jgi:hypothetical protein
MKTYYYTFFLWLIACLTSLAAETNDYEWGPVTGNFQVSIRLKGGGTEIKTNQPIDLIIRIRNLSTNETLNFTLWNWQAYSPSEQSLTILSPSGKDIYVWHSPIPKDGAVSGGPNSVVVPPQKSAEYGFHAFGLSENITNGVYKVIVKRKVLHGLTANSNTLLLKVVPGVWKDPAYDIYPP